MLHLSFAVEAPSSNGESFLMVSHPESASQCA